MIKSCEVCKELQEIDEKIEVDMLYGHKSGYFHLMSEGVVNYCPTCGKRISREEQPKLHNNDKKEKNK